MSQTVYSAPSSLSPTIRLTPIFGDDLTIVSAKRLAQSPHVKGADKAQETWGEIDINFIY